MTNEQPDDDSEHIIQIVANWLNASGIRPGPRGDPSPIINVNIDKVILANDKAIIGEVKKVILGDEFERVGAGATIINRSSLVRSMNTAGPPFDTEVVGALVRLKIIVEGSDSNEALENFNALSEELERPQPRKGLLKSFWAGIVVALPGTPELLELDERIRKLFS
jgi:hypothetical protein